MVVVEKLGREYQQIPIELIKSPLKPSREIFEGINALAETVRRYGLLQPILVKQVDGQYGFEVVVGERRLRACKKAGLAQVPCIVVDGVTEEEILQMQLIENLQRSDLKVFEVVRIVKILKDHYNLPNDEIAVKTGLSSSTVANYLTIAKGLPREHIKTIAHGSHSPKDLTLMKAVALARADLPADKLKETVELIKKTGLTRHALAKKLAKDEKSKIKRVVAGKGFWKELTRSLKEFANYWPDYSKLREWEDIGAYHLSLEVTMPKDLNETNDPDGLETLSAEEAPQICGPCGNDILKGDPFVEKEGIYYCHKCVNKAT